jgi:hypothetical protein
VNGKHHGKGVMKWANGDEYEGKWIDGKRHGKGLMKWADGREYTGDWVNDRCHGQGQCTYINGYVYNGELANGIPYGYGRCVYADGDVYEGNWVNGKRHGQGHYTWADGRECTGDWENNKRHGKGRYMYLSGNVCEGEFVSDKMHGKDRDLCLSGNVCSGVWVDGTLSDTNWELIEQGHSHGNLLINKRRIPYECINLINESLNQSSSCTEEVVALLALKTSDIECPICYNSFATDLYTKNESAKNKLPVLGTCDHVYCHGCVLQQQNQIAKMKSGVVPKQIDCMLCRKEDAFRPNKPKYDRRLIDWLSRSMPVCTYVSSVSV